MYGYHIHMNTVGVRGSNKVLLDNSVVYTTNPSILKLVLRSRPEFVRVRYDSERL